MYRQEVTRLYNLILHTLGLERVFVQYSVECSEVGPVKIGHIETEVVAGHGGK